MIGDDDDLLNGGVGTEDTGRGHGVGSNVVRGRRGRRRRRRPLAGRQSAAARDHDVPAVRDRVRTMCPAALPEAEYEMTYRIRVPHKLPPSIDDFKVTVHGN